MPYYTASITFEVSNEEEAADYLEKFIAAYCEHDDAIDRCKRPNWAASMIKKKEEEWD